MNIQQFGEEIKSSNQYIEHRVLALNTDTNAKFNFIQSWSKFHFNLIAFHIS